MVWRRMLPEELGAGKNTLKQEAEEGLSSALRMRSVQLRLLAAACPGRTLSPCGPFRARGRRTRGSSCEEGCRTGTQQGLSERQENRVTEGEAGHLETKQCGDRPGRTGLREPLFLLETPDPSAQMQSQSGQHLFGPGLLMQHKGGPVPEELHSHSFGRDWPSRAPVSAVPLQLREFRKSRVLSAPQGPHL